MVNAPPFQHIAIRLPNWLGDICMAMPIIRAVQAKAVQQNPQVEFSFLLRPQFEPLLDKLNVSGHRLILPQKKWRYFAECRKWRAGNYDAHLLLTHSLRGDLEASLIASPHRIGMVRPGKWRPLLNCRYHLDKHFDREAVHQTRLWEQFCQHFDLLDSISLDIDQVAQTENISIGLICGSANSPEKRWPVAHWQALVNQLSQGVDQLVLFGTADDGEICEQIQQSAQQPDKVQNLAGKTSLAELVDVMRQQRLIIGNDTGGLHLANLLGVSAIGLYGPTNPVRTRPIHNAPLQILQSANKTMQDISVDQVASAATDCL